MQCRSCPLSLRCLAGRLGNINYCPYCGFITVGEQVVVRIHDSVVVNAVRLRCERRNADLMKGVPPLVKGTGIIVPDPMGGHMAISQCAKCDAKEREAQGWKAAPQQLYNNQELDDEVP